ncbi:N-acetyl-gamma-glutamyl-phosphate reductase [Anatilimnocola aggregata]|uniref:N-acetyl-gamma-glutamyl-phosphate reductase n=1 Tax=Anatilimnocola aggregata TaxID=2528021 RepID=A0A517Y6B8_9BACT|nr:N-acetyl-gamma-glutamyl-phosphate reductase [Anatilimnocola aggregata]QDU25773.1 N-acetyl-gamma-glutamyl-phosphate reductase [Anatilimnocola aggregata]
MIRVGILGATGYTALELIKILLRHPDAQITAVTSRQEGRPPIAAVHPCLTGRLDLPLEDFAPAAVAERCDCIFSCLPHAASAESAKALLALGKRVIDFSADYRLNDPVSYRKWYEHDHPDAERLGKTVYGLPELFREQIPQAALVANPGCYPTSAILPLAPFLKEGWVESQDIIVDSKSGVSGAGRTPKLGTLYPECNESISAYSVGKHRHSPEIEQILGRVVPAQPQIIFTPHLVPMDRGILTVSYSKPTKSFTEEQALELLRDTYRNEPFVQVVKNLPATKDVAHTNFCHITPRVTGGRLLLISVIDNLIKGASGAAAQNFNLMYGFKETTALV